MLGGGQRYFFAALAAGAAAFAVAAAATGAATAPSVAAASSVLAAFLPAANLRWATFTNPKTEDLPSVHFSLSSKKVTRSARRNTLRWRSSVDFPSNFRQVTSTFRSADL